MSAGQTSANLHINYANASGRLGDVEEARRAITAAHDARQRENVDDLLDIGGEFMVSTATHHYLAGNALNEINGAEGDAAEEIERAVAL